MFNSRAVNYGALAGALAVVFWAIMEVTFPDYHPSLTLVAAVSTIFSSVVAFFTPDTAVQKVEAVLDLPPVEAQQAHAEVAAKRGPEL